MTDSASPEFVSLQRALAGRFSLEREIGRGGMGVVFLARDVALDRAVAIKLLPPDLVANSEARERFLREARTVAQLSHPNVVPIHLVEERDGVVFFVMSFIDGESVGDRVRRVGPMPAGEVARVVQEIAWALAYAHGRGVVHRDVKPDNVMLDRASGRAMLTDFGIARRTEGPGPTTPGLILGSLQYMAPEQADPDAVVDGRADIYALGVTAFHALTGRLPFESVKPAALIAAHLLEPAPPVSTVAPGAPPRLAEIVDKCLTKSPGARWQSGEELADALDDLRASVRAMPPSIRSFESAVTGALGQILLLIMFAIWVPALVPEETGLVFKMLGAIAIFPLISVWAGSRAVAIAGFGNDDVAQALAADRRVSDRYTEHLRAEAGRLATQLKGGWARVILGAFGGAQVFAAGGILLNLRFSEPLWETGLAVVMSGLMGWVGVELTGHALQVGPFKDRLQRYLRKSHARAETLTSAVWSSGLVRGLLALGRLTSGTQAPPPAVENRPTEVMLAGAVNDLFESLLPADRAVLDSVPEVIRELEAHGTRLRVRKASIDAAIAAVGDPDAAAGRGQALAEMRSAKQRVDDNLRLAVEALEILRLDLLRLKAGVGSTADLTDAVQAARKLGEEIDYALAGRAEVAGLVSPR